MQRRAFIHIGLAKTGTTAIQQSATSLQDDLLREGLLFLRAGRIGQTGGQHGIPWRIRQDARADLHCPDYNLFETREELVWNADNNVIVSSEEFSPLAYRPNKLRDLCALFDGYRLCGIVYVREQVEHFNSFFVELVKDLDMLESIGEYTRKIATETRYDYSRWMQPFAEAFDELVVRPFDPKDFVGGSIVQDFYAAVGYTPKETAPNIVRNQSLSALQVAALQHAARQLRERGVNRPAHVSRDIKRALFAAVQTPQMRASGPYWGIPPRLATEIRDSFRPLNSAFFEHYADRSYDFPNHQEPRPLNVAVYEDVPAKVKAAIAEIVDGVAVHS